MFTAFVAIVLVALWVRTLSERLKETDRRVLELDQAAKDARAAVTRLTARIAALEASAAQPRPEATPVTPAAAIPATEVTPPVKTPAPVPPVQVAPKPVAIPPAAAVSAPAAIPRPEPVVTPAQPVAPPPAPQEDAWEVTVGGSWLNKIGVLVFVIGLALLVGYSVTHVGPAGRIAIGFAVSFSMLAAGVALERRDEYRSYAHGLIAGGWAGIYFTTYAMRAIEAARVLESDLIAIVALTAVAAAMVWHSLRYRSQEVTALAYVVAYATLALTPLHAFSLSASVPLAISVLVVAHKFGWPRLQILGVVFTYGLYVLRGQAFGFGELSSSTFTPYVALAVYWVMFEIADLLAIRRRVITGKLPPPIFLLNAAGMIGSGLLQLPLETPLPLSTFLMAGGVAYLASAIARGWITRGALTDTKAIDEVAWGSYQAASAVAVALVAWAIELRFTGSRLVLALLIEAELVFLTGLILRDAVTRGIGSALALLVGLQAMFLVGTAAAGSLSWIWAAQAPAGVAALTALTWYANREWLRSRAIEPLLHEWLFTPVATYLLVLVARAEWEIGHASLATLIFSLVLLEAGLRRGREYRYQAFAVGGGSALVLLTWFSGQQLMGVATAREGWWILMMAMAVAYFFAWRIAPVRGTAEPDRLERVFAAATAGALGTAFVVLLEWIVIPPDYIAVAWAATATILGVAGLQWKLGGLRWQMYPILALALLRALNPVLQTTSARPIEIMSALFVIGVLYAFSLAVRRGIAHAKKGIAEIEDAIRIALSVSATLALVLLIYAQVRATLVTVTWGLQGAVLLATGFPTRERLLRLSGLGVLLACIARLFVFDLPQLEELARIISFVALGAVLLAVSWIYTRYRAQIQKFL